MREKIKEKEKKLVNSFKYAICGIKTAIKTEQNMKIHVLILLVVVLAGVMLDISKIEWIICIILFGLVISAELVNTSLEAIVDIVKPEMHPKAKIAKDVAASSVLVMAVAAAIVGLIIFVPRFIQCFNI